MCWRWHDLSNIKRYRPAVIQPFIAVHRTMKKPAFVSWNQKAEYDPVGRLQFPIIWHVFYEMCYEPTPIRGDQVWNEVLAES